jgi:hypothetical protein
MFGLKEKEISIDLMDLPWLGVCGELVTVLQCVCRNEPKNTSKEIACHKHNYNLQPTY